MITIQISQGELLDRWSILSIKRMTFKKESDKWQNVCLEMSHLESDVQELFQRGDVYALYKRLLETNLELWSIEDALRKHERDQCFDKDFIFKARKVYHLNDERSDIKRKINELLGSKIKEEKIYEEY